MAFTYYIDPMFNDFRVKDGQLIFVRGVDCTEQQIKVALLEELGEWFLDIDRGIPYYSSTTTLNDNTTPGILGGKLSAAEISAILRRVILEVPNVTRVETFEISQNTQNRSLSIRSTVQVEIFDVNGIGTQSLATIEIEV